MFLYEKYQDEIKTLHLLSQIVGKIKLEYATQEPQWAHIILDLSPRGFSTGLLEKDGLYFEIEVNLVDSIINIETKEDSREIKLEDGKSISDYYKAIMKNTSELGLELSINTKPQEMEWKLAFEKDETHHHYSQEAGEEILKWFQLAWNVEQIFIGPIRQRKVYPGLFWGTFDVSCIVLYNKYEAFPDDSKVIERAAFDEHMIEFGFWLGDENFKYPTFFILPYPFVEGIDLEVDDSFPKGSYFSPEMAEYLYEVKEDISQAENEKDKLISFMEASFEKSMDYLKWKDRDYYFKELKMEKNKK